MSAEKDDDLASIGFAQNFMVIWNGTYAKESRCIHSIACTMSTNMTGDSSIDCMHNLVI